jgi:hypothetical protein
MTRIHGNHSPQKQGETHVRFAFRNDLQPSNSLMVAMAFLFLLFL